MKRFIVLFLIAGIVQAQNSGNAGLSFLKIGLSPKIIATGDLGVAGSNDISGVNYNPAILTKINSSQILFSHNSWIQDVQSEFLTASFNLFNLPFAVSINSTSVDDIEIRTRRGEADSKISAYYFYTGIGTGINLMEDLSAGISVKYLYEGIYSDEADGWGFDFGLLYTTAIENLEVGASLRNIGSMSKLRAEKTVLPAELRLGAAYKLHSEEINSDLNLSGGFLKLLDVDGLHLHLGAELDYSRIISFRFGYVSGYDSKSITTGLGVNWNKVAFDYSYIPFANDLGSSNTIALTYTF
ncbi:MAG: PorV/PorQ family protein [Bacteroidota bacterium]|nr:PorV/PorQ family protein [Bacteroidota bacterium]